MGARLLFGASIFEDDTHVALLAGSHDEIPRLLIDVELSLQLQVLQLHLPVSDLRRALVFVLFLKCLASPPFHDHFEFLAQVSTNCTIRRQYCFRLTVASDIHSIWNGKYPSKAS